ncbi:PAS domain S-box protein (plasmid) [Halarchaeum sp. CBA1220]|uniref:PAS domain S-box protein n=1 Tax=Halarchaeum sp. CBA1220 TaxID=1853682 RepID=UPI0013145710|nr:PAS domain S-box protein [Halarchaeum sp. CBA1220]QLC35136.1 PAS domain S-box protein [Halarchaeum sp. CBA1220]
MNELVSGGEASDEIRVLHVDDDAALGELVATSLERVNDRLSVETVQSADAGLDALADAAFDCVVSDYDMPGRDGIEFLRVLRATHPRVPFILYTGKGSEEVASDAITAGASDYLQKEGSIDHYGVLANRIVTLVEHERAETTMNDVQRLFSELADRTTDVLWLVSAEWEEVVFINDAYEDVFGQPRERLEANPRAFLEPVAPADRERLEAAIDALGEGVSMDIEVGVAAPDGTTRDVWIKAEPITDESGAVTHLGGFTRDVTERTERERELASAERQYRAMFEDPNILVGVLEPDGVVRDINQTAMEYIEGDLDDVLGEPFAETPWWGDDDALRADVDEWVARAAAGEYVEFEADITGTDRMRTVSGTFRPVRDDDGTVTAIIVSDRDITERTDRERELERYEAYLERSTDIVTVLEADGTVKYQSPSVTRTLGYESGELVGSNGFGIVHPDDIDELRAAFLDLVEEPGGTVIEEARFRAADGEWRWLEVRGRNHLDHPVIRGVVTNNRDITERKRNERELVRVRDLLEKTERIADVGGWEIDAETMDVFWSENLFDILGIEGDEEPPLEGALDVYHEEDRPIVANAVEAALEDGESFDIEVRFLTPSEDVRWLRVQGVPVLEDGAVVTLRGAVQDVTEQKRDERELTRQNERLEEFASVVSHDLRNPLNVASGYLDLARETSDSDALAEVERAHERMNDLIDDLLTLARTGDHVREETALDLAGVAEDAWRHVPTGSATLEIASTTTVYADRSLLQQLLENLFRNAVEHGSAGPPSPTPEHAVEQASTDSRREGGTGGEHGGDEGTVTVTVAARPDGFVVADDGPGIPAEARERVFDAGYSTSEAGTGFGLAITERCADAHGWTVRVTESERGGARFEFTDVRTS